MPHILTNKESRGESRSALGLGDSEERFRDLLDNANDLIQSIAPDGSLLYVNQAWKTTLGYTDDEVARLNVFDVITPSCLGHCSTLFQRIMQGETLPHVDVQFTAKDGSVVHLEGSINCSMVDGRPVATRGIFRDVTERNRIARELHDSEERYRQLVEHAPEAILVQSGGRYVFANSEGCRLFGAATVGELLGRDVLSTVHPDYQEMVRDRISIVQETGRPSALCELKIVRCDGSAVDVDAVGTRITYQGATATQVILRDITERKAAEREREEWSRVLEQRVAEKTRNLEEAQAKLIQSEKMAMLGEVISGTSHALNNPLAGILGAVQVLRGSLTPAGAPGGEDEWLEVLEGVEQAATRCHRIIEKLITFSTQTRCYFSWIDLNEVLRGALEVLHSRGRRDGLAVVWEQQELPPLEGDYLKLMEVFSAVMQNASEAMAASGTLEISATLVHDAAPRRVVTRIRDTGGGIPPHNLSKIFDPFFSTKSGSEATGLGLTVSYGIVKRHNGDIDVHSIPHEGTEVTVTLPLQQPG